MKKNIQLVQVNNSYGNQYFIPYSVGLLQAYAEQYDEVKKSFNFLKIAYKQENNVERQVKNLGKLDIVALSCYLWNWKFNLTFARMVKKYNPNALVIFGGPQVPDKFDDFFEKHPHVDVLCHGEGEIVFYEILKKYLADKDYGDIPGASYNDKGRATVVSTPRRSRAIELEAIPSPYLENTFAELLQEDIVWQASWETNRGCPYRCTFCVWGAEYFNKMRKFPLETRLLKEVDWFAKNKIDLVFGCDANFGVFKRDIDIAKSLVAAKEQYGYPKKFRVCNAKNSNDRVLQISEILNDAGMAKGISLSMQSMNEEVLNSVKRKNIGIDKFKNLMNSFNKSSMVTYTEIILPLPDETYESFISGLDYLVHAGQHSQINIYNCTILQNSEMASEESMKKYGIQTVEVPVFQAHVDNKSNEHIEETELIAVGTKTMPKEDWFKSQQYSWAIQTFHALGLLQYFAIVFVNKYDISYSDFYLSLTEYAESNPKTIVSSELRKVNQSINNILVGKTQGQLVPEYNLNIIWPPEEASLLRILEKIDIFYVECAQFVRYFLEKNNFPIDKDFINDLCNLQREAITHYGDSGEAVHLKLNYNLNEYIRDIKNGLPTKLIKHDKPKIYEINKSWKDAGNKQKFAREIIWYGRKGGKLLNTAQKLEKTRSL